MKQYQELLRRVLDEGEYREDRTGTGTFSLFGEQLKFDLQEGFPLLTTKKLHTKSIFGELLWFLSGSTNTKPLKDAGISIWDEWADDEGDLGPVYGKQWRSWECPDGRVIDQVEEVIRSIPIDPWSRRHIVSAWNVADLEAMALPPCHLLFQFYVRAGDDGTPRFLDCQLYQRSADMFLGLPYNIASYALLMHIVSSITGLKPGVLTISVGDAHLYANHMMQAQLLLSREPRMLPQLSLRSSLRQGPGVITLDDIILEGYNPHPGIKAPVAV